MKEKPINFTAEMARAIWEGRETLTLRVMKPQPLTIPKIAKCSTGELVCAGSYPDYPSATSLHFPPYQPGDRLWVKEPHQSSSLSRLLELNLRPRRLGSQRLCLED